MQISKSLSLPLPVRGMAVIAAGLLALTACAPIDDTTGSRLTQPPPGGEPRQPVDANDIAIVGQEVAHSIMDLPQVANATVPPMVQFTGVTSIVKGDYPVDTEPYTELFRDRLLLITREKLRFVEHTLPPLVVAKPKKLKKHEPIPPPVDISTNPDYEILAELRGNYSDDFYKVQVQFVDSHTNDVLFDGLYRIRKEAAPPPSPDNMAPSVAPEAAPGSDPNTPPGTYAPPPPSQTQYE
ncbi:MAG: hypothetical protein LV479_01305 [Methylacidiphilales bacterium]|nr:hypothetical protein [Candidatus Methylacidiphilales bacterium]